MRPGAAKGRALVQGSLILGALASLIAIGEFVRTNRSVAVPLALLILLLVLASFRRPLAEWLRRYQRDILFTLLGATAAVVIGGGALLWQHREPPEKSPETTITPAPVLQPEPETQPPPPAASDSSTTVYRTPNGEKYHRAGCRYIKGKAIPISLTAAKERGLTACKVCKPPPLP